MVKHVGRLALIAIAAIVASLACGSNASAGVEISTGIRYVGTGPITECSTKAQSALSTYMQDPTEVKPGSGDWLAFGPKGQVGAPTSSAAARCYPLPAGGYVITFTCVVQIPENPYAADALCLDVAHTFKGLPVTALATPAPLTGCATTNLVGHWTSDDKPGLSFDMTVNGELTDSDGVSGNWGLYGNNVTLTYYGTHSATLSADGKHINGGGYSLTRKC